MPKFKVCVEWKMHGEYTVEAETLEAAIRKVDDNEGDKYTTAAANGKYNDDSFQVNRDMTYVVNEMERQPNV